MTIIAFIYIECEDLSGWVKYYSLEVWEVIIIIIIVVHINWSHFEDVSLENWYNPHQYSGVSLGL